MLYESVHEPRSYEPAGSSAVTVSVVPRIQGSPEGASPEPPEPPEPLELLEPSSPPQADRATRSPAPIVAISLALRICGHLVVVVSTASPARGN